ncbi:MAG: hypothetical protein APF84_04630 [Gracilibacter sp. BRH_c7a]|nr:MAG: hypothetical protein APF84_04630 [Gracilibacter sp. BRH_c7a]
MLIGVFGIILIASNLYYGGTVETWSKSIGLLLVLGLALALKVKRIKSTPQKLDERLQLITYRAISIGFYLMLSAIFWFYTKEMIIEGQVSIRTIIELVAGLVGYLGSFLVLNKRY